MFAYMKADFWWHFTISGPVIIRQIVCYGIGFWARDKVLLHVAINLRMWIRQNAANLTLTHSIYRNRFIIEGFNFYLSIYFTSFTTRLLYKVGELTSFHPRWVQSHPYRVAVSIYHGDYNATIYWVVAQLLITGKLGPDKIFIPCMKIDKMYLR